jgi:phosphopentomutase
MSPSDIIALVIAGFSFLGVVGMFFDQIQRRVKEGEEKGRLMQRVDEIEKKAEAIAVRVTCVEDGHSDTREDFATFAEKLKGIDEKLSTIMNQLDRREKPRGD